MGTIEDETRVRIEMNGRSVETTVGDVVDMADGATLLNETLDMIQTQIATLLDANKSRLFGMMEQARALQEQADDGKIFRYRLQLAVTLTPMEREAVDVQTRLTFGTRVKREIGGLVRNSTNQPELPTAAGE